MFTGVNTRSTNFQYTFTAAPIGSLIRFRVKAPSDAHVMLSEYENPSGSQPYYEVRNYQNLVDLNIYSYLYLVDNLLGNDGYIDDLFLADSPRRMGQLHVCDKKRPEARREDGSRQSQPDEQR